MAGRTAIVALCSFQPEALWLIACGLTQKSGSSCAGLFSQTMSDALISSECSALRTGLDFPEEEAFAVGAVGLDFVRALMLLISAGPRVGRSPHVDELLGVPTRQR